MVRSNRSSFVVPNKRTGLLKSWRTTTAETREKAAIPPVYRPFSRTRNVGKATWLSGLSVFPFPGVCFLVSWFCGCFWPSVPVLFRLGLVPSCGSCPPASSVFVPRVCFKEEATTQGTDPKTGFSDRPTTCRAGSRWWSGKRSDDPRTDPLTGTSLRFTWPWDWLLGYVSLSIASLSDVAASQVPSVAAAALFFTVLGVLGWLQMVIIDIVVPKIDIFAFSTGRFNIIALDGHLFEDMMATCHRHVMLWWSRVGKLQRQVWNC